MDEKKTYIDKIQLFIDEKCKVEIDTVRGKQVTGEIIELGVDFILVQHLRTDRILEVDSDDSTKKIETQVIFKLATLIRLTDIETCTQIVTEKAM